MVGIEEKWLDPNLSRRSFVKASALTVVATGAIVSNPCGAAMTMLAADNDESSSKNDEDEIYYGSCRANCFSGCRLKITVRDGKVVKTTMADFPDERYNRVCLKGHSHVQRIYDKNRLKYSMKRVGERGSGEWEIISWEEAIETITDTWKEIQTEYGNSSLAYYVGSGCFSYGTFIAPSRLMNLMQASKIHTNVDNAVFYGTTNALGVGEFYNGNELTDLLSAKTILIWGANPANAQMQNMHFILEAQKSGAQVIVIDPVYTTTASKADIHVTLRPGTDSALAMAMANIIIEEDLTDKNFMKTSSVAPFLVKKSDGKYLRQSDLDGEVVDPEKDQFVVWDSKKDNYGLLADVADPALQGTYTIKGIEVTTAYDLLLDSISKYTPEYASELCDIPVDTIKKIARIYATNTPSTLYHGFGPDHYVNGHYAVFAACMLAIITGNVGKPGASAGYQMPLGFYFNNEFINPTGNTPGPDIPIVKLPDVVKEKN